MADIEFVDSFSRCTYHAAQGRTKPARSTELAESAPPKELPVPRFSSLATGASPTMTHVVAEPCFACKYTDCVVVCPVECFYEGDKMVYIHPDECIDCEACVPECPVEAIFHEDNLPAEWKDFTALNAEMSPQLPVITEKKDPLC
jgi:ferredoxin